MHYRLFALLLVLIILVSGCISGQVAKRQAAEQPPNTTLYNMSAEDYGDDFTEETDCSCPSSIRMCPDGFNATCENECTNGTCSRCVPSCSGHERCNESWFCGEWQPCENGSQSRMCMDSSFCNKTVIAESRTCETDRCSFNSDCPAESNCTRYFCEGSPKACKPYVIIPCCGDGVCDGGEDCISDCPTAPCDCSQLQCAPCNQTSQTNTTFAHNISITNITYKMPESVEIWNFGNGSADMSNWTLSDNATTPHTFTFPAFVLLPNSSVRVHTENGTDSMTDLYWNRRCYPGSGNSSGCVWNDGGDIATLKNRNEIIISIYSY